MMPRGPRASVALSALLLAIAPGPLACGRRPPTRQAVEEQILERRRQGLEALTQAARRAGGRIVNLGDMLVVVRQTLVQQVLDEALPFEQTIAERYLTRIGRCQVRFEDGFALVELDGSASLVSQPATAVQLTVFGGLDLVELDRESSALRARVKVFAVEARRVDVLGLGAPAEELVEDLSRQKLDEFSPLLSSIEIPVRLEQRLTLPPVGPGGGVTIEASEVPLNVAVAGVLSFRHRLWVTLSASPAKAGAP